VLLAHIGSFVPAAKAVLGPIDRILTRIGAGDDLARGQSTFMVEMSETSYILHHASAQSLVLMDEIGRGTSTYDGLALADAVARHLAAVNRSYTLFATHYHELNELESLYDRIKNFNVQVKEHDNKVIFMRKLVRGGADHSYGIQVADMAGLPQTVIDRAKVILGNLEKHSLDVTNRNGGDEAGPGAGSGDDGNGRLAEGARKKTAARRAVKDVDRQGQIPQMSLFQTAIDPNIEILMDKLEAADPNRMTPIEALMLLSELKRLSENG
jgi:DNA mismatch repair protein MutS